MRYNKPEVLELASPLKAIEGQGCKPCGVYLDTDPSSVYFGTYTATISGYEADE